MTRSVWLVGVLGLAAAAGCAAATEGSGDTGDETTCDDGQCDLAGRLPTTPVTLPFSAKFQVAAGDISGVAIQPPPAGTTAPVFAQVHRASATGPSVVLWASTKQAGDIAEKTGLTPHLQVPASTDLVIGLENKSAERVDGTLAIAYTAEEAFCGGKTVSAVDPVSQCDGEVLRVCGHDFLQGDGRSIRYLETDCSTRGGCDAAAGRCKSSTFPMFWCEGSKVRGLDGRNLIALETDCAAAGTTCANGRCVF